MYPSRGLKAVCDWNFLKWKIYRCSENNSFLYHSSPLPQKLVSWSWYVFSCTCFKNLLRSPANSKEKFFPVLVLSALFVIKCFVFKMIYYQWFYRHRNPQIVLLIQNILFFPVSPLNIRSQKTTLISTLNKYIIPGSSQIICYWQSNPFSSSCFRCFSPLHLFSLLRKYIHSKLPFFWKPSMLIHTS